MTSTISFFHRKLDTAFLMIVANIVCCKSLSVSTVDEPLLAKGTIGHYMLEHRPQNYTNVTIAQTPECSSLNYNVDTSTLNGSAWSCASSPTLVPRRRRPPSRIPIFDTYSFSATYDDSNGNGYNITYPTQLCSFSVIGDVMSPQGYIVPNATLQSVWTSLAALSSDHLYTYTDTILQRAFDKFDAAIQTIICDPPVGGLRALLTRYTASQVSGKWVLALTGSVGVFGIAFGTMYVPVAHPGITANLTGTQDTFIIAASVTLSTLYFFALTQLSKTEYPNIVEAFIFTVLVTAGEGFLYVLRQAWTGVCTTTALLKEFMTNFHRQTRQETVVVADANQAGAQMVAPGNPAQQQPPTVENPAQVQVGNVCG